MRPGERAKRRIRGTTPEIDLAARELRRSMTMAEHVLWAAIRRRQMAGLRFRRQHPLGRFILDFVCPERKIVVELDGPIHTRQVDRDEMRTQQLVLYGYRVLRFHNDEVLDDLPSVLERIATAAEAPTPTPPPKLGEG